MAKLRLTQMLFSCLLILGHEQKERELELNSPTHIDISCNLSFIARFLELQVKDGEVTVFTVGRLGAA